MITALVTMNHPLVGSRGRLPLYVEGKVPGQCSGGGGTPHTSDRAPAMMTPVHLLTAMRVLMPQCRRLCGEARLRVWVTW